MRKQSTPSSYRHWRNPSERTILLCEYAAQHVAEYSGVDRRQIFTQTRSRAHVARARQLAMYLAHTLLRVSMTDVGICFARDRTTVAHACATIEDSRDDRWTDRTIGGIEDAMLKELGPCFVSNPARVDSHVC